MIEQKNYSHISTYVFKADAALDAASASAAKGANSSTSSNQQLLHKQRPEEREKIQSKLDFATAIAFLGQGNYEKAALTFLKLGSISKLGDWVGKVRMSLLA